MRGARVASICTGAFVLAATGLLDGWRATTHWLGAADLARRHPSIDVDANVLYVDNGRVLTSAGAAAGFDLCLHMVRRDLGADVAMGHDMNCMRWIQKFREPAAEGQEGARGRREGRRRRA